MDESFFKPGLMSSSWQCKRRDCRMGNDITAVQMFCLEVQINLVEQLTNGGELVLNQREENNVINELDQTIYKVSVAKLVHLRWAFLVIGIPIGILF